MIHSFIYSRPKMYAFTTSLSAYSFIQLRLIIKRKERKRIEWQKNNSFLLFPDTLFWLGLFFNLLLVLIRVFFLTFPLFLKADILQNHKSFFFSRITFPKKWSEGQCTFSKCWNPPQKNIKKSTSNYIPLYPFLPLPQAGIEVLQPEWFEGGGLLLLAKEALNYDE